MLFKKKLNSDGKIFDIRETYFKMYKESEDKYEKEYETEFFC